MSFEYSEKTQDLLARLNAFFDLALAFVLSAAWPVQKAFRTSCDRTYEPCKFQDTISACGTFFQKYAARIYRAHKQRIAPDVDRLIPALTKPLAGPRPG